MTATKDIVLSSLNVVVGDPVFYSLHGLHAQKDGALYVAHQRIFFTLISEHLPSSLLKNSRSVILRKHSDRRISIISSKSEILRVAQDDKLSTTHFFNSLLCRNDNREEVSLWWATFHVIRARKVLRGFSRDDFSKAPLNRRRPIRTEAFQGGKAGVIKINLNRWRGKI